MPLSGWPDAGVGVALGAAAAAAIGAFAFLLALFFLAFGFAGTADCSTTTAGNGVASGFASCAATSTVVALTTSAAAQTSRALELRYMNSNSEYAHDAQPLLKSAAWWNVEGNCLGLHFRECSDAQYSP
jgi:hypothetical protein